MTTLTLLLALVAQTPQVPTKMIPPPAPAKAMPQATVQATTQATVTYATPVFAAPAPVAVSCAPTMTVAEYAAAPVARGGFFRFKQKTKIRQGLGLGLGHRRMRTATACY